MNDALLRSPIQRTDCRRNLNLSLFQITSLNQTPRLLDVAASRRTIDPVGYAPLLVLSSSLHCRSYVCQSLLLLSRIQERILHRFCHFVQSTQLNMVTFTVNPTAIATTIDITPDGQFVLTLIALGIGLVPTPRAFNDTVQVRVARLPA